MFAYVHLLWLQCVGYCFIATLMAVLAYSSAFHTLILKEQPLVQPCQNKCTDARGKRFHFKQVWYRMMKSLLSYVSM